MTIIPELTGPERAAEEALRIRKRARILRVGGCAVCTNRDNLLGVVCCSTLGRTFPLCQKTPGVEFDLDEVALAKVP